MKVLVFEVHRLISFLDFLILVPYMDLCSNVACMVFLVLFLFGWWFLFLFFSLSCLQVVNSMEPDYSNSLPEIFNPSTGLNGILQSCSVVIEETSPSQGTAMQGLVSHRKSHSCPCSYHDFLGERFPAQTATRPFFF